MYYLWKVWVCVDALQDLHRRAHAVVVAFLDVFKGPFVDSLALFEPGPHPLPVEAAVASTCPVFVLEAVVEPYGKTQKEALTSRLSRQEKFKLKCLSTPVY